jgi:hypothetical protein
MRCCLSAAASNSGMGSSASAPNMLQAAAAEQALSVTTPTSVCEA